MSTEDNTVSSKDEFTLSQLVTILKKSQTLVPANTGDVGLEPSDVLATEADWKKFWTAVNKIDVPVTFLVEPSDDPTPTIPDSSDRASAAAVVKAVELMLNVAAKLWKIFGKLDDKPGRSEWTKGLIMDSWGNDPTFNYVVVYPNHSINFSGVEGQHWSVREYTYQAYRNYKYKLYAFRSGTFVMRGDGGYLNWCFIGRVVSDSQHVNPRTVVFRE